MTPIRITRKDAKEYKRLVKNTKAKISRTQKNYGIDLSSEVTIPSLDNFSTRKEFNQWKQEQESFTNRANLEYQFVKNKHNVVATKRELLQAETYTRRAINIATELQNKLKDKPFISGGQVQGTVEQRMLQVARPNIADIHIPNEFGFDDIKSRDYFDRKTENMKKRADPNIFDIRAEIMKENYITLLEQTFNSMADGLIEQVRSLRPDIFLEIYTIHGDMHFDYFYTLSEDEVRGMIDLISNIIRDYEEGNINFDLKGF